jgi:hypothetical protein
MKSKSDLNGLLPSATWCAPLQLGMAAAVLAALVGCAPAQLSPHVARTMVDLRQDLVLGKTKVDSTTATLTDLMKNPRLNTERQVSFYQKEMSDLEQVAQRVRDTHTAMQANSDDYFKKWEGELGQIQNKEIAAAGAGRKEASMKAVETVRAKLDDAKEALSPFMSNLRDISRYFKQDQTAEAVTAIKPVIQKTLNQKQTALKKVDEVIAEIDRITKSVQ